MAVIASIIPRPIPIAFSVACVEKIREHRTRLGSHNNSYSTFKRKS